MAKPAKKSSHSNKGITEAVFLRPALFSAVIVLLVIVTVQVTRTSIVLEKIGRTNNALIHEMGQMREGLIKLGDDSNEVREYMALPSTAYDFFPKEEPKTEMAEESPIGSALFKFTDEVGKTYLQEKALEGGTLVIQNLRKDKAFNAGLAELSLGGAKILEEGAKEIRYPIYRDKDIVLATLIFNKTNADFTVESILGTETLAWSPEANIGEWAVSYLKNYKEDMIRLETRIEDQKKAFIALVQNESITPILQEKKLQLSFTPVETAEGFEFSITNADTEIVLTLRIERKTGDFLFGENRFSEISKLEKLFISTLGDISGQTERSRQVSEHENDLSLFINDKTFQEILEANALELSEPKEEGNQRTWELKNKVDGTLLGRITFEILTGNLRFFRASDNAELSIDEILGNGSKKKP